MRRSIGAQGTVARRGAVLAAVAALAACASQGMPPGGPPDAEIPKIVRLLPDSNAVNVRAPAVVIRFDEVVNERSAATPPRGGAAPSASGSASAAGLAGVLVLSPSDGRDEVIWRREALELRPRRGFRPNTTYRVTLMPGLADLRGNRVTEPFSYLFSTGPSIPSGAISGVVFDWTTGKPAAHARVEVFLAPDTTFRWSTRADSLGRFRLGELADASYELRAWIDGNNDRRISFREVSDAAQVSLVDTASLELYAYVRDTLPPRLEVIELVDSTALRIRLDRGIVADWDGRGAELVGADSSVIPLGGPFVPSVTFDSLARLRAQAARDSVAAAADTAAADTATADTSAAGREVAVPAPHPPDTVRVENTRPAQRDTAARAADSTATDSTATDSTEADTIPVPVFRRSVPVQQWTAPLAAPLAPGDYLFRIRGARGLNGRSVDAERQLRVVERPRRPAPRDTTATPPALPPDTQPPRTPPAAPARR